MAVCVHSLQPRESTHRVPWSETGNSLESGTILLAALGAKPKKAQVQSEAMPNDGKYQNSASTTEQLLGATTSLWSSCILQAQRYDAIASPCCVHSGLTLSLKPGQYVMEHQLILPMLNLWWEEGEGEEDKPATLEKLTLVKLRLSSKPAPLTSYPPTHLPGSHRDSNPCKLHRITAHLTFTTLKSNCK